MNNKEFIAELAQRSGFTQEDTQQLVKTVTETMCNSFAESEAVTLAGFGTFDIKKRLERTMVNPATGQRMLVPPRLVLNFKPNSNIKGKLKKGGKND